MNSPSSTTLPRRDQRLLEAVARIVPAEEREEWTRTWHAELWHLRHASRYRKAASSPGLTLGLTRDALWLRTESVKRSFAGTPTLCLGTLAGLILFSTLLGSAIAGTWQAFEASLSTHFDLSLSSGVLVCLVSLGTNFRRRHQPASKTTLAATLQRLLFLTAKATLVWLLAFLLSTAFAIPLHRQPIATDLFQAFDFVLLALSGLRWALTDQESRCRQCLHALTPAARIGRPSRNLLEWNGTELSCKHGHGLLSIPEMETSWRDASQWVVCSEV